MRSFVFLFLLSFSWVSCRERSSTEPHVRIVTKYGEIELELYPKQAPKSVAAFLSYLDAGLYERCSFYRVLNEDNQPMGQAEVALIQGGTWATRKDGKELPGIPHESTRQTGLLHKDGTVSLARQAPGTANTEFFICIGDQPGFDMGGGNNADGQGYAAFGKVIKGMDVVRRIHQQPSNGELFDPKVDIVRVERF